MLAEVPWATVPWTSILWMAIFAYAVSTLGIVDQANAVEALSRADRL